jgi:hypothetical protein
MPVEAQVFEAWIWALAWERVSDAPLRKQRLVKFVIQQFPGIRTSNRKTQKRVGLEVLRQAELDPTLKMKIEREIKLAAKI